MWRTAPLRWRWRDLPIRQKGLVVIAAPIVPLLVTTILANLALVRDERARRAAADSQRLRTDLQAALTLVVDAETGVRGYLLSRDPAFLQPFDAARRRLDPLFASIRSRFLDDWERDQLHVIGRLADERLQALQTFVAGPDRVTGEMLQDSRRKMDGVRDAMAALFTAEDRRIAERLSGARRAGRFVMLTIYAGAGIGLWGGLVAALLFTRGIADGVERLGVNADRLVSGEPLLPVTAGGDELGRVKRRLHEVAAELKARDVAIGHRAEQLAAVNRELEAFSYSVSHDLRAPLRHVVGFSALLEQKAGGSLDETGRRYVRTIVEAATRMGHLIDDLLAFARMAKAEMVPTEIDLNALVADILIEAGTQSPDRDNVEWTLDPLPRVRGDRAMLRMALLNLVSNALKYTSPRERAAIEIGATTAGDGRVTIYVKDNGVGFDMQYADKLFGVFQRLHSSDQFEGTGIGLANVRRIVQRHGGETWAEGRPGAGATFYVSLPAA